MPSYLGSLFASQLPFDPWVAVVVWLALFVANHRAATAARAANDAQSLVTAEDWGVLRRGFEPKHILARILFTGIVFLFAFLLGSAAFVFFGGGLIVAIACTVSLNVQGLLSARSMARPNSAKGALTFSTGLALQQLAFRLGGAALACCLIGAALAHLALLGGALILAISAGGYSRRARKAVAPA